LERNGSRLFSSSVPNPPRRHPICGGAIFLISVRPDRRVPSEAVSACPPLPDRCAGHHVVTAHARSPGSPNAFVCPYRCGAADALLASAFGVRRGRALGGPAALCPFGVPARSESSSTSRRNSGHHIPTSSFLTSPRRLGVDSPSSTHALESISSPAWKMKPLHFILGAAKVYFSSLKYC